MRKARFRVTGWSLAVAGVVAAALALRLWGIEHGLPYVYNPDEMSHFVPKAVRFFEDGYNPQYFINPPALSYVLHVAFALWFGGGEGVTEAFAGDRSEIFLVARAVTAALGAVASGLVYVVGARLFDRRVGLVAAVLLAVAYLPVVYSHEALNDVPALVPIALSLLGIAGIVRSGRLRDYALAGAALGLAVATKYNAALVLVAPLVLAAVVHAWGEPARRRAVAGLALAFGLAGLAFVTANPYALLDFETFRAHVGHLSEVNRETPFGYEESALAVYARTFGWGFGWLAALAALGGAIVLLVREPRTAAVLLSAPVVFFAAMSGFVAFPRFLLPLFPLAALLAGYGAVALADFGARASPRLAAPALGVLAAALAAQGLVFSAANDVAYARTDTRELAREWMFANIPAGATIVLEPAMTPREYHDRGRPPLGERWRLVYPDPQRPALTTRFNGRGTFVGALTPELVAEYERERVCWIVSVSSQSDRVAFDRDELPQADAYYRSLARASDVVYHVTPYRGGRSEPTPIADWSTGEYPLAFARPGPEITVYRLGGGACADEAELAASR